MARRCSHKLECMRCVWRAVMAASERSRLGRICGLGCVGGERHRRRSCLYCLIRQVAASRWNLRVRNFFPKVVNTEKLLKDVISLEAFQSLNGYIGDQAGWLTGSERPSVVVWGWLNWAFDELGQIASGASRMLGQIGCWASHWEQWRNGLVVGREATCQTTI